MTSTSISQNIESISELLLFGNWSKHTKHFSFDKMASRWNVLAPTILMLLFKAFQKSHFHVYNEGFFFGKMYIWHQDLSANISNPQNVILWHTLAKFKVAKMASWWNGLAPTMVIILFKAFQNRCFHVYNEGCIVGVNISNPYKSNYVTYTRKFAGCQVDEMTYHQWLSLFFSKHFWTDC